MTIKTISEMISEEFCNSNNLPWKKIKERDQPTVPRKNS
jgi:hypothetical protein